VFNKKIVSQFVVPPSGGFAQLARPTHDCVADHGVHVDKRQDKETLEPSSGNGDGIGGRNKN